LIGDGPIISRLAGYVIIGLPHRIGPVISTGADGFIPAIIINPHHPLYRHIAATRFVKLRAVSTNTLPGGTKRNKQYDGKESCCNRHVDLFHEKRFNGV